MVQWRLPMSIDALCSATRVATVVRTNVDAFKRNIFVQLYATTTLARVVSTRTVRATALLFVIRKAAYTKTCALPSLRNVYTRDVLESI